MKQTLAILLLMLLIEDQFDYTDFGANIKPLGFPEEIESLQPIPRSDNLVKYLKKLIAK